MTESTTATRTMTLTFFASAADAAGVGTAEVSIHDGDSYRDVLLRAAEGNDRLGRIVAGSAVFAAGSIIRDLDLPATGSALDVLPPFAGG